MGTLPLLWIVEFCRFGNNQGQYILAMANQTHHSEPNSVGMQMENGWFALEPPEVVPQWPGAMMEASDVYLAQDPSPLLFRCE